MTQRDILERLRDVHDIEAESRPDGVPVTVLRDAIAEIERLRERKEQE